MLGGFCKLTQDLLTTHVKYCQFSLLQKRWNHVIKAQDAREIQVPLPHGKIAGLNENTLNIYMTSLSLLFIGKEWGSIGGYPILCLHGLADNCDSFAPLAPLLSEKFHYIAVDAFGNGWTTHLPLGPPVNYWEKVIYVKRVVDHLKMKKFSINGHSMGGSTGLLFASLYPDLIDRLLTLDIIKPVTVPLAWHTQNITEAIELHLDMERKSQDSKNQKSYTREQLVSRYVEAMGGTIYPEAVRVLMKRGSKVSGNGYVFSHDPRMVTKHFMFSKSKKIHKSN